MPFDLETPALLVDQTLLKQNLHHMATWCRDHKIALRPHIKSHKCPHIARLQIAAGAIGVTCATVAEAAAMADAGIASILIANEVVSAPGIRHLISVAQKTDLIVAVDDAQNAADLGRAATAAGIKLKILVEVDIGLHRCGVPAPELTVPLAQHVAKISGLAFAGLLGYEGHCVFEPDVQRRRTLALAALEKLAQARRAVESAGLPVAIVSAGGTGTYDITGAHPAVTEIQPGSYALMDGSYLLLRPEFRPALRILATVISSTQNRIVLNAGLKTVGFDHAPTYAPDHPALHFQTAHEEHSLWTTTTTPAPKVGAQIPLIPGHGCTTCNLHRLIHPYTEKGTIAAWQLSAR